MGCKFWLVEAVPALSRRNCVKGTSIRLPCSGACTLHTNCIVYHFTASILKAPDLLEVLVHFCMHPKTSMSRHMEKGAPQSSVSLDSTSSRCESVFAECRSVARARIEASVILVSALKFGAASLQSAYCAC